MLEPAVIVSMVVVPVLMAVIMPMIVIVIVSIVIVTTSPVEPAKVYSCATLLSLTIALTTVLYCSVALPPPTVTAVRPTNVSR